MSEYLKVKSQMKDKEILKKTLEELGFQVKDGMGNKIKMRGWMGRSEEADLVIPKESCKCYGDIGLSWNGESYDMIFDDHSQSNKLRDILPGKYADNKVQDLLGELEMQGFCFERMETEEQVVMLGTKW